MGRIARRLFALSTDEVRFDTRQFRGGLDPGVRQHIETIGLSFLEGFHGALESERHALLEERLEAVEASYRGFAYEGAAMSLFLLDRLVPWRHRFPDFFDGPGRAHIYLAYVGAGWALARLPFGFRRGFAALARLHPLYRWLAVDGYGFHQGFFHWRRSVEEPREIPRVLRGYARRAFDQGLGRSLWFVDGADAERIPHTIAAFPRARQADLWSGLGLAATYAGGVGEASLQHLGKIASTAGFGAQLAQGAAFAAEARRSAANLTPENELASRLFTGLPAREAAELTVRARQDLPADGLGIPAYEAWRLRIQEHWLPSASAPTADPPTPAYQAS